MVIKLDGIYISVSLISVYGFMIWRSLQFVHQQAGVSIFCTLVVLKRWLQGIPAFRDFTIRDPRYFLILFWASFHDFKEIIQKKTNFRFLFFGNFFWIFFFKFLMLVFRFSDCHLMNIKISMLDMTIIRNSLRM